MLTISWCCRQTRSPIRMVYQFENLGGFEPVYLRQIQKPKIPISRNVIKRRKCPESKSKILVFRFEIYMFRSKIVMRVARWTLSYLAPSTFRMNLLSLTINRVPKRAMFIWGLALYYLQCIFWRNKNPRMALHFQVVEPMTRYPRPHPTATEMLFEKIKVRKLIFQTIIVFQIPSLDKIHCLSSNWNA